MADLPNNPNNREEEYLADIANLPNNVPDNPWSRKEAYLAAISGRLDGIDAKIAALATDISLKGGVADYDHLPTDAAIGDAYITEDTGILYVWVGDEWTPLNMQGGSGEGIKILTQADANYPSDTPTAIKLDDLANGIYRIEPTASVFIRVGNVNVGSSTENYPLYGFVFGSQNTRYVYIMWDAGVTHAFIVLKPSENTTEIRGASLNDIFSDQNTKRKVKIGGSSTASGSYSTAVGYASSTSGDHSVAIGRGSGASGKGAVALGTYSQATIQGQMDIGVGSGTSYGYNGTAYRLLTGVHDPVNAHDAATKGYVDSKNSIIYLADSPHQGVYGIHIYSDKALTHAMTGSDLYQMIENGGSITIKYSNEYGTEAFPSLQASIPPENTAASYTDNSVPAVVFSSNGLIDFSGFKNLEFASTNPSDDEFNIQDS